jgi:hypothetical protein
MTKCSEKYFGFFQIFIFKSTWQDWPSLKTLSPFYIGQCYNKYIKYYTTSGLYYKSFTIVIYERNAIGQYYKTTIVVNANYDRS